MRFRKLANMIIEAKGEKPGQRFHAARNQELPAGISSSPIGRSDYNPQKPEGISSLPADTKATSVRNTEIILRNAFRLIKGDPGFRRAINNVLEGFNKKRKNINAHQEKILTHNPGHLDKLYGDILRYERILAALPDDDARADQFSSELASLRARHEKYSDELAAVIEETKEVIGLNEETSLKYQDALIDIIQQQAKEEYDKLAGTGEEEFEAALTVLKSFDQLDPSKFDDTTLEQEEMRLQLLGSLLSEDDKINPLYKYFMMQQQNYQAAKDSDSIFKKLKANTQNVTVESFWNRLPVSAFSYFYNATRDDLPLRPLTGERRRQLKAASPIRQLLDSIKSEQDFEQHRAELLALVHELNIDKGRMQAVIEIINGPYARKGATVVQRLRGLLKGVLKEDTVVNLGFDLVLLEVLSKHTV